MEEDHIANSKKDLDEVENRKKFAKSLMRQLKPAKQLSFMLSLEPQ